MFHEHARAVRSGQRASVALVAVCCEVDTIPKPDGLAGPLCGPFSNQNRTQLAQCPVLFERVRLPSDIRGQVKSVRRCLRSG